MLSKQCSKCGKTFFKDINCSLRNWNFRVKYCSRQCSNAMTLLKKGHQTWNKGLKGFMAGEKNNMWKGGPRSVICKICSSIFYVYRDRQDAITCSKQCHIVWQRLPANRLSMSQIHRQRVKLGLHNLYRGITELKSLLRQTTQYKQWRNSVFVRDDYECVFCGVSGEINADHIKPFAVIIVENNLKSLDDAIICGELWDVDNGRTLCIPCHKATETYGRFTQAFIKKEKVKIKI